MTILFQNILTASFHGSVVILAVLLLRLMLKKTPKKFLCLLWLLAGIRLLMPFEIRSDFSLQPEAQPVAEVRQQVEEIFFFEEPSVQHTQAPSRSPARNEYQYTPAAPESADLPEDIEAAYAPGVITEETHTVMDYMSIAAWIWLAVASLFLVYTVYSYTRLKLLVRESVKIPGGWECDSIETAFILGFIRPRIYIPMGLSQMVQKHILSHERTHLEKGDHWFKMIGFIALALHWFNPLVWVAYILLCKDIEMACDERVVQFMSLQERKEYSAALLNCSSNRVHFAACPVAFGEVSVKERIKSVLKYKKPGFWISLAGVIAIIFVAVCLVTSPAAEDIPQENTASATEPSAPMTDEEKEQLARSREEELLQQVKDGLDAMFSKETTALEFYSSYEGGGAIPWQCAYLTHDGNKLWSIHDYRDGRIEKEYLILDGIHYDYQDQLWVAASAGAYADPLEEFREWFHFDNYDELYGFSKSDISSVDPNYAYTQIKFVGLKENMDSVRYTFSFSANGEFTGATITGLGTGYGELLSVSPSSFYTEKDIAQRFEEARKNTITEDEYDENKIPSNTTDYDRDFMLGSGQMRWYYFDKNWQFACGAENATATGLTMFYCESDEGQQSLTADEGFWLEQLVDGKWQLLEPSAEVTNAPAEKISVSWTTRDTVKINWKDSYGTLSHGFYRLGRYHTLVMPDGRTETTHAYAKFRIYDPNQDVLLNKCRNAVNNLVNAQHYHLYTFDWMTEHDYEYYHSSEVWKHGKDYLEVDRYPLREDLSKMQNIRGSMWRDGKYYSLSWEDEPAVSPVSEWSGCVEGYMDDSNFSMWSWNFEWYDAQVEEVYQEGNTIHIIETYDFDDTYENTEIILTFDNNGNLKGMVNAYLPKRNCADKDKVIEEELVVFDTAAKETGTLIDSQDIDTPMSFSWEDDQHFYPDMQATGFKNTSAKAIKTCTDAVARADKESTMEPLMEFETGYCQTRVFHDDTAGMWKVELFWWQHDTRQIIYMNDQGITQGIISEE